MLHEFSIPLMTARHLSPRAAKQPKTTQIIVLLGCIFIWLIYIIFDIDVFPCCLKIGKYVSDLH